MAEKFQLIIEVDKEELTMIGSWCWKRPISYAKSILLDVGKSNTEDFVNTCHDHAWEMEELEKIESIRVKLANARFKVLQLEGKTLI